MKKLLLVFMLSVTMTASAGLTRTANTMRGGDIVKTVEMMPFRCSDDETYWDFSQVLLIGDSRDIVHSRFGNNAVVRTKEGITELFELNGDSLMLKSLSSANRKLRFTEQTAERIFPISHRQTTSAYCGEGSYNRTFQSKVDGFRSEQIVAEGSMITPEGDSLRNVVRVRTIDRWQMLLSEFGTQIPDTIMSTVMTDTWWAEGYRYPIVECREVLSRLNSDQVADSTSVAFYSSPRLQVDKIKNDEENEMKRERMSLIPFPRRPLAEKQGHMSKSNQPESTFSEIRIPRISFAYTENQVEVSFFNFNEDTSARFSIVTPSGRSIFIMTEQVGNVSQIIDINLSGLSSGVYLLVVDTEIHSESFCFSKT